MKRLFLFSFMLFLFGCQRSTMVPDSDCKKFKKGSYTVDYGGCLNSRNMKPECVGQNLYRDEEGHLFFLTYDRSDETGKNIIPVFIQRFSNNCADHIDVDTLVDFSEYELSKHIDIENFEFVGDGLYQDKNNQYFHNSMADGGSLNLRKRIDYLSLEKGFYKGSDGNLYIKTRGLIDPPEEYSADFYRLVPEIDIESFRLLGNGDYYAMDNNHVYKVYSTTDGEFIKILEDADPGTFEVIGYRWGKDKNFVYENGVKINLNPNYLSILCPTVYSNDFTSFEIVKDNERVYYFRTEVKDIDVKSFECITKDSTIIYQDKNWIYPRAFFESTDPSLKIKRN